ncbi:hypothetical protein ACI6Q2_10620 [Chitinophagaceae bacterium LWZ2-11]
MRKIIISLLLFIPICSIAQGVSELVFGTTSTNLNDIKVNNSTSTTASSFFFKTGATPVNNPIDSYVNYGINVGYDINSFHQIVFGNANDQMFFRTYSSGFPGSGFGAWNKIWHSGNFNPSNYLSYTNGNVGIGTTMPSNKLTLDLGATRNGIDIKSDGDAGAYSDIQMEVKTSSAIPAGNVAVWNISHRKDGYFSGSPSSSLEFYGLVSGGGFYAPLSFKSNGDIILASPYGSSNLGSGNVSIGDIDAKGYKLSVNGNIRSKKITVTQQNWPDYVFDSSYTLAPLSQVEQFIKDNKHLPDVPSAKEVADKGLDVGDNQAVLLKKIEELTLYMIEMKKENTELKQRIEKVENKK